MVVFLFIGVIVISIANSVDSTVARCSGSCDCHHHGGVSCCHGGNCRGGELPWMQKEHEVMPASMFKAKPNCPEFDPTITTT